MGYVVGQADNYKHLLNRLRMYAKGWAHPGKPTFTGTGNGVLSALLATASTVAETWTIHFTSATAFTVTGSVSGAAAGGTAGTPYTNTWLSFLITAGGTAFVSGDEFVIVVTAALPSGDRWVEDRYTSGSEDELILHGPGSGSDAIYVGIQSESNVTGDWYNWRLAGFTGYVGANTFANQPGSSEVGQVHPNELPLWNGLIPYWFIVSGRRIIVVAKVSTVYVQCYLGFLATYATPGQYPYPLVIGGSLSFGNDGLPALTSNLWRFSSAYCSAFYDADTFGSSSQSAGRSTLRIRLASGTWRDLYGRIDGTAEGINVTNSTDHYNSANLTTYDTVPQDALAQMLWPSCQMPTDLAPCLDGSLLPLPVILGTGSSLDGPDGDLLGELDGVFRVPYPSIASEQTIGIGGVDYLIAQNAGRTSLTDYAAFRLN